MYPFIILAAGKSSRMGQPKPFVMLNNGLTLLENLVIKIQKCGVKKIIVVLNNEGLQILINKYPYLEQKITIVINPTPEKGRFLSLKFGIENCDEMPVFVQNVDNPYVYKDLIQGMTNLLESNSYIVPQYKNKGGHPILLSSEIVSDIKNSGIENINIRDFLKNYSKIFYVCNYLEILLNLNNPQDIELFL